jgi:uncharacterized protein YegL
MKAGYTKIVFVVDRSGSMSSIAKDMEGGFRSFIEDQKKNNFGQCDVSLYQFDTEYDVVFENKDIQSEFKYTLVPRGSTAMNDAIGKTINTVGETLSKMNEADRPDRVLFVIVTDGEENASKEFTTKQVKELIDRQSNEYNWTFTYLGANQNAWAVGAAIGISKDAVLNYAANAKGVVSSWGSLNSKVGAFRGSQDAIFAKSLVSYDEHDIKLQDEAAKT